MNLENKYWIALSDLRVSYEKINQFLIHLYNSQKNINQIFQDEAFNPDITPKDLWVKLHSSLTKLNHYQQIIIELKEKDFSIIPINSPLYSKRLKQNLKTKKTPPVIFTKGNNQLLNMSSVAVVGSRNASDISLKFTDEIVRENVKKEKVIVSGYAKGVDRQALNSALKYKGKSVVVLPQGILKSFREFEKYKEEIASGRLLFISQYFPNAAWSVQNAMARNSIIYGLSEEIYVAESNYSGGTWTGVREGLKWNQKIFVRCPDPGENNANNELIKQGASAFNWSSIIYERADEDLVIKVNEPDINKTSALYLILNYLSDTPKTSREIKQELKLDWSVPKITSFLKKNKQVDIIKTKPIKFRRKDQEQLEMFH